MLDFSMCLHKKTHCSGIYKYIYIYLQLYKYIYIFVFTIIKIPSVTKLKTKGER